MLSYAIYLAAILSLSDAISCPGSAKYKLTFKAEWTAQTHPEDFPSQNNPHFSSVAGCSHNASYVMWGPGMNATQGVKNVAEVGATSALNNEMDSAINAKNALRRFIGRSISNTGTRIVKDIEVNTDYSLVSAITMIAPSPDWFTGVHDYNLCNESNGKWFDKRVKDLFLYDSGTDDALTFVHSDTPSKPPVPIFLITNKHEGSLKSNHTIKRFGTFTFEKTSAVHPTGTIPPGILSTGTRSTMETSKQPTGTPSTKKTSPVKKSTTPSDTNHNATTKQSETTPTSSTTMTTSLYRGFASLLKIIVTFVVVLLLH